MKISRLFSVITVAATFFAGSFVVHAADSPDLVEAGAVRVEDASRTPLTNVHVHQEEGTLVVWGTFSTSQLPGHVDVMVLTPDRKTIAETQVVPTVVRRGHPGGVHWSVDAKLLVTPPPGSIVKVAHGFGRHETRTEATPSTNGEQ